MSFEVCIRFDLLVMVSPPSARAVGPFLAPVLREREKPRRFSFRRGLAGRVYFLRCAYCSVSFSLSSDVIVLAT